MSAKRPCIEQKALLTILGITVLVVVVDQLSKLLAVDLLTPGQRISIIPGFFDLTLTYNKGAAFGLFSRIENSTLRYVLLSVTTALALTAVFYFFVRELSESLTGRIAFALIFGGAIGNIIDRVRLGEVVDFFLAYYQHYYWPVFNVADSFISVGVVMLLLFHSRKKS